MFDFGAIAGGLHKIIGAAEAFSPFTSMFGLDKITGLVKVGLDIAENVADRAQEAGTVLNSSEQNEIDDIITRLREKNDELAAYVDNS